MSNEEPKGWSQIVKILNFQVLEFAASEFKELIKLSQFLSKHFTFSNIIFKFYRIS